MKSKKPPAPDPLVTQIAQQNSAISAEQMKLGRESLDFSKQQYADSMAEAERLRPIFDRLAGQQIEAADLSMELTKQAKADYDSTYRPIEQRLAADAMVAGSEGEQTRAAGLAGADVQRNLDMQREIGARQMASMGVRPDSGRFAGMNRTEAIMGAAARAGAETGARAAEKLRGDTMRMNTAAIGKGQQGLVLQGAQVGTNVGGAAAGAAGQNLNTRSNIGQQYQGNVGNVSLQYGNAANTNSGAAGILNTQYGNRLQAWQASQQAKSGLFGALGNAAGMAAGMYMASDEDQKTRKRAIGKKSPRQMIERMRFEKWQYKASSPANDGGKTHVGTYAQDFKKQTGLGDGKTISVIDAVGVTMAAQKELSKEVRSLRRRIAKMGAKAA